MTPLINNLTPSDNADVVGSRLERIDPDNFSNQSDRSDGPASIDDDDAEADTEGEALYDEPVDEGGGPAFRSGSV